MIDAYSYPMVKFEKVINNVTTEPTLQATFDAKREKERRLHEVSRESNSIGNNQEYLESLSMVLKYRSRALKHQLFEIGRLLYEAKKNLSHGEFKPWIESNFQQGYRTATNCMNVYLACFGNPSVVEFFNPSCLYIIAKPSFPIDLREALFDGVKGPVDLQVKEIVEIGQKFKKGILTLESDEIQSLLVRQEKLSIWKRCYDELAMLENCIKKRFDIIQGIPKNHMVNPLLNDNYSGERTDKEFNRMNEELIDMVDKISQMKERIGEKCK